MRYLVAVIFAVFLLTVVLTEGKPEKQSLSITSLTIKFEKTDAIFTVDYDIDNLPKMYLLLLGSKGLEPKLKAVFSNFDYEILKMDQNKAVLRVKNITRFDKGYYLHDSHIKFGEGISTMYVYTPDSPDPKKVSNPYLFSWDSVTGNESATGDESFKLRRFLKDELDINGADSAKIIKSDDGRTIDIFTLDKTIEITLDKNKKKALLRISGGKTYELQVREENGRLDIYSSYIYSTPNIYYRS